MKLELTIDQMILLGRMLKVELENGDGPYDPALLTGLMDAVLPLLRESAGQLTSIANTFSDTHPDVANLLYEKVRVIEAI